MFATDKLLNQLYPNFCDLIWYMILISGYVQTFANKEVVSFFQKFWVEIISSLTFFLHVTGKGKNRILRYFE